MNKKIIDFLATGFYSGKLPIAPGTWGTFVAFLLVSAVKFFFDPPPTFTMVHTITLAVVTIAISIYVSNKAVDYKLYGEDKDPSQIVIDEFAGYFVAIAGLPFTYATFIGAFILFRLFDIKKVWPANKLEALPRGYGITLDDVAAGVYANLYIWVIIFFVAGGWTHFV